MKPRVLLAVVDRAPWTKHRAALPDDFEIVVVETARDALEKLAHQGPFAVVAAELRIAGMSGLDLLQAARQHMPDTSRILVVAGEDREAAIEAVNQARVLAFFVHPFAPEVFATSIREGVEQHQRRLHDQAVLTQTVEGVVQMLTGLVHPTNSEPEIPASAQHLRNRALLTAQALRLPTVADLEIAALLSQVALSAAPHHLLDKLRAHEKLTPAEMEFLDRMPDVGLHLVESQPHFAGVAEVFRHQGMNPGPAIVREDGVREHKVPLASRILRAVVDLQLYEDAGLNIAAALAGLRKQAARYDLMVLKALELIFAGSNPATNAMFEECMVADLEAGSVLAMDALSHDGVPLVAAGGTLTLPTLERLRNIAALGEVVEPLYVLRTTAAAAAKSAPTS